MQTNRRLLSLLSVLAVISMAALAAIADDTTSIADLEEEVRATETAFARSMADRDLAAFTNFLDEETVFFNGDTGLRGRDAVGAAWSGYFEGEHAPFSWAPEAVAVLESGTLGLSSGPVLDPEGNRIGTFNSVWRRNADGEWKVVFDRGCP